jgi:Aspartyl protease
LRQGALSSMVRVVFTNPKNNKRVEVGCLIDSGADDILLNPRIAAALGLDLATGTRKEYQGITSAPVVASEQLLSMKVEPDTHEFTVACSFLADLPVFGLLGQNGFFDNYKVVFKRYEDTFELTPISENEKSPNPEAR